MAGEDVCQFNGIARVVEFLRHRSSTIFYDVPSEFGVLKKTEDGLSQSVGITLRCQQPSLPVLNQFRNRRDLGGNSGYSHGQTFHQNVGDAVAVPVGRDLTR